MQSLTQLRDIKSNKGEDRVFQMQRYGKIVRLSWMDKKHNKNSPEELDFGDNLPIRSVKKRRAVPLLVALDKKERNGS